MEVQGPRDWRPVAGWSLAVLTMVLLSSVPLSLAGGVHDYEMVLKYVQLAVQIHTINTVCLINHEDCRAYGREGTYKRHRQDLLDTGFKIHALFPDLRVETFYLRLDGNFESIE